MNEQFPISLVELSETTSTNDEVKRRLPWCDDKMLVVSAMCQTAGRGQKGNKWESNPRENLLYSIGIKPCFLPPRCQFLLLQAASLSICRALNRYASGFRIKWPNDIYYGEHKISGTLIEIELHGDSISRCVLGSGINLNQMSFSSYPPNPISLKMITDRHIEPKQVLSAVISHFTSYYELLEQKEYNAIREQYCSMLFRREGFHAYRDGNGVFSARLERVEPDGHLLLRDADDHLRRYGFKEVRFVLNSLECN